MTTAYGIIKKAMQKAGILTKTDSPSSDEANDALDALNAMLSSWSNDSMMIYARVLENFSITAGVSDYSIGPSQTFNTVRPIQILEAHVRQGTIDYDLPIINDEIYQGSISQKSDLDIPRYLNYSIGYPYGTIRLWPVPPTTYSLYILSEKLLSQFALTDTVALPPGWEQALIYNLGIMLCPDYGQEPSAALVKIAGDSKASIAKAIIKNHNMDAQPADGLGWNNIFSGGYR